MRAALETIGASDRVYAIGHRVRPIPMSLNPALDPDTESAVRRAEPSAARRHATYVTIPGWKALDRDEGSNEQGPGGLQTFEQNNGASRCNGAFFTMKFWVGVTDNRWFAHLAARRPDEVNFWQPSATPPFKGAPSGLPFLFKLKRPGNMIAGGGFFVTYSTLPLPLAWEVFGEKNGASSFAEFRDLVAPLSRSSGRSSEVGCTVLSNPFFLEPRAWIEPAGWSGNIVRGKMYSTEESSGASIWDAVGSQLPMPARESLGSVGQPIGEPGRKYGQPLLVTPRLGQSSFRVLVTDAYKRRCAITGENTLAALEAAHIVPYAWGRNA